MTTRKQRRRPDAGIEIVYEDEQYSAIALYAPLDPNHPTIQVYSKTHRDLLFEAISVGLLFECKRCRREHLLRWYKYNRKVQADEPPYRVLCEDATEEGMDPWLVRVDESLPDHLKAHSIYTITGDMIELIASIATFINNQQC